MIDLDDLYLILLVNAHQRDDGYLFPMPTHITAGQRHIDKAVNQLLQRGFVEEIEVRAKEHVWRQTGDKQIGIIITPKGRAFVQDEDPAMRHRR